MRKLSVLLALLFSLLAGNSVSHACTTAIISGKYTRDGRPLLFKHRDTSKLQNKLMVFTDGKYKYIGLVNSIDSLGSNIWAGVNSAGFAIMNSASYNLNLNDTTKVKDREGIVMKMALQNCATVEDFEEMLRIMPKPLGVEANFGVIDARGGAAYFETGNYSFTKFDVNDPSVAPFGYIIRTNYSYVGAREKDYGLIRYQTAEELFNLASQTHALSVRFLLQDVSRCLKHSLTGRDLTKELPPDGERVRFVDFRDFIPRHSSASTVVVQGVKAGESAALTTMWTILGFQLCSVAIPCWVSGGNQLPQIMTADFPHNAPLCDMALTLKERCFPMKRGSGKYYLNLGAVINQKNDGILQKLRPVEDLIIQKAEDRLEVWRHTGIDARQVQKFYRWVDETVRDAYLKNFGLKMTP